jgi:hypothetical protein
VLRTNGRRPAAYRGNGFCAGPATGHEHAVRQQCAPTRRERKGPMTGHRTLPSAWIPYRH